MTDTAPAPVRQRARPTTPADSTAMTQPPVAPLSRAPRADLTQRAAITNAPPVAEDTSWMKSGTDGIAEAERVRQARAAEVAANATKPMMPYRYKLDWKANNGMGESGDVIILDAQPGPRWWEHKTRNPRTGYWTEFEQCPHEWDNCPLCPPIGEKSPYYVMMLTVIDMRSYVDRNGQPVAATRKLLPIMIEQQGIFDTLFQQHGTLRGVHLIMTRDGGKMSPVIGNNIVFDSIHPEEEIVEFAKGNGLWEERKTDDGRVIYGEGEFIQPFRYGAIFERPSGAKLRAKYLAPDQQGGAIGGAHEQQGEGWRNSDPGRAAAPTLQRSGSSRRVNLEDSGGGAPGIDDEIPF